jgi:two-component system response regulator HydG
LFEAANHGTIFLDEVGDLPPQAQVKLLRVLQEGEVKRVGSNDTRVVDVRVVAATHVDLKRKIEEGTFREDLFYRLNVVVINLPSLRERKDDIPGLALHFLKKYSDRVGRDVRKISPEAMELLLTQDWPGNVRELENAIERAIVFCKDEVRTEHLGLVRKSPASSEPPSLVPSSAPSGPPPRQSLAPAGLADSMLPDNFIALPEALPDMPYREAKDQALAIFDRFYFTKLRERTNGNVSEAARQAGLDRSNFRRAVRRACLKWRDDDEETSSKSTR